ncbi:MAG: TMEM165/GDT1 family protein [Lentisphaerae bacterium]|jgi:putative Ca2+/H+ antiporter (TMEM165/GDT1 family)|nr:TMEM165/GDT1 family protein [Lentisphaerota bacterium]
MLAIFLKTFGTVFIAELGDKTQLTCMGFAATDVTARIWIFLGSALALALSSAIAVYFGCQITQYVSPKKIKMIAGIVFIIFGLIYLKDAFFPISPLSPEL